MSVEERLRREQKLKSLGTLAGGIPHDLNNLPQPIILNKKWDRPLSAYCSQSLTHESGKPLWHPVKYHSDNMLTFRLQNTENTLFPIFAG